MASIKKVVCPTCKAKLTFDPDKITREKVKFKCPGCTSVLVLRKPEPERKTSSQPQQGELTEKVSTLLEVGGEPSLKQTTGGVNADESRKNRRVKFKKKVLVNNQIMVEVLDISEKGLFLHTGRSFEQGARVELGIPTIPGNFDLKVNAMVVHDHRGIGMGLQFVDLDDGQKMKLQKLISELDEASAHELEGRKKILLAGGTDTARNINKSKLVLEGFYVMQATTAEEIFRILDNEPPDAMILEWQEENFNCPGLLANIKEVSQYDNIIRIVLSTLTDSSVQREILAAGAHRCMAKMDTNPARLALILKQMINEKES